MADPRFYENRGPFALAEICAVAGMALPPGADAAAMVADLAALDEAGAGQLAFFAGTRALDQAFAHSRAGFCLIAQAAKTRDAPSGTILLPCASPAHAFAAVAALFYPGALQADLVQAAAIAPSARLGRDVALGPGVVIGEKAEIGDDVRIGANTVIGHGVAIGHGCRIGSQVCVSHAYIGDRVLILPGARIGQPGFGLASSGAGHIEIPQLGRVIIQDAVEVGASTTIDRGALGDTVIGEGTKIDNLVQVGHNVRIGRHCVIAAQTGIAGSCLVGDFVVMGGQVGLGDHTKVGARARLGARSATVSGQVLEGGRDYGGVPAKPIREWARELYALNRLARRPKRDDND